MDRLHAGLPIPAKRCAWNMKYGLSGYPRKTRFTTFQPASPNHRQSFELGCGRGSLLLRLSKNGLDGGAIAVLISQSGQSVMRASVQTNAAHGVFRTSNRFVR